MMSKNMHIAVATNQKFVRYLSVMLVSLFENNKEQDICIYLMSMDITEEQKGEILQLADSYGQTICFLRMDSEMFPEELPASELFTLEAYFRLALPDLMPKEVERVLYLDVDIIVNSSLAEFYGMDFAGKSLCVCRDVAAITENVIEESPLFAELREQRDFVYFNSGVLLMNLSKLRETVSLKYFVEQAMRVKEHLRFFDQDLLNYLFYGDVLFVDEERYNLFARTAYNIGYTYEQVKEQAVILHYAGPKPWRHEEVRYELERFWWEYAKKTPYYSEFLEEIVLAEVDTCYMDQLFRSLKQENDELRQIVDKCMILLKNR